MKLPLKLNVQIENARKNVRKKHYDKTIPLANYTDWATVACRLPAKPVPAFLRIEGWHVGRADDPHGCNLRFLDPITRSIFLNKYPRNVTNT
jgi:hypothetical protein